MLSLRIRQGNKIIKKSEYLYLVRCCLVSGFKVLPDYKDASAAVIPAWIAGIQITWM